MPEHLESDNEHDLNYPLQTYTNAYLHPDTIMSKQEETIQSHALQYTNTDTRHHNTRFDMFNPENPLVNQNPPRPPASWRVDA